MRKKGNCPGYTSASRRIMALLPSLLQDFESAAYYLESLKSQKSFIRQYVYTTAVVDAGGPGNGSSIGQ